MKLSKNKLSQLINEYVSSVNYQKPLGDLKFPPSESELYTAKEIHAKMLVALEELPSLIMGAVIPPPTADRMPIDEEESSRFIELAEILRGLQE